MTPEGLRAPAAASPGWLLRTGTRVALSSLLPLLALTGVLAVAQVARRMLWPALLLGDPSLRLEQTLLVAGAALLFLVALGRAVVVAVAVQAGAARIQAGASRPAIPPARAGLRGIGWAAVAAIVDLVLDVWFWGVLVASGIAAALGGPVVSLLGFTGLALALTLGLFLGPAASLWLELGLVVSVVRPARVAAAAREALVTLLARPGVVILAWLVTALPAGFLVAGVQVLQARAPGPSPAASAASGVALVLIALVEALATLVRLDALAALVLDRQGELPPAPRPRPPGERVPVATLVSPAEVVEARPVGPMAPWNPGAPG